VRDDEELLWRGAPDESVRFTAEDAFLVPFSILGCGTALAVESLAVISSHVPVADKLWGIPVVAMGLYLVAGRLFYKSYRKRRTAYAITNYRALIVRPRSFAELPLRDQPVTIKRSRDSRHVSVTFGNAFLRDNGWVRPWGGYVPRPNTGMELMFPGIRQPFAFYDVASPDAMLRALDQARTRPAG
jgi:hypothetical protein